RDYDAMMRDYYRRRAPEYEETYARPERQRDLALLRAQIAKRFAGRRTIDVACGTGYWSAPIAHGARSLIGVDANEAALALARDKRLRTSTAAAQFVQGDAYGLDASLGRFDAAFVGFFWSHVPHRQLARFIESLHARLVPAARVLILDNAYVEGNSTPIAFVDMDGNAWQERLLSDGTKHRVLKNFPGRDTLIDQLARQAPFTHWWRLDYYWLFEYRLA
ncbi:MAG: class I SAM-dependent methyltransferase, partial [Burkholderiaceae bacterium]